MPIQYYIILAAALFCIGVVGVLIRRNAIIVFMCIELMLNSVNLMLVAFSKMHYALSNSANKGAPVNVGTVITSASAVAANARSVPANTIL